MATSEALAAVRLTTDDAEAGLRLSDEAGWNQTADDWRVFIRHGDTIGVKESDGQLIASAAALPYGGEFGFVAMVLVTASWRRRGLANRLVNDCVERLERRGLTPVLDATPAGALVYRQQGFIDLFGLERWQAARVTNIGGGVPAEIQEPALVDRKMLSSLDAQATGGYRDFLLGDFMDREGSRVFVTGDSQGFALVRRGRRADHVGPVVAATPAQGIKLLQAALSAVKGAVYIDVPTVWSEIREWLAERGFTVQRGFSRMARGRSRPFGNPEQLFAVAGPEFG
jgi:GNAT superfamily N-acetyltransferase